MEPIAELVRRCPEHGTIEMHRNGRTWTVTFRAGHTPGVVLSGVAEYTSTRHDVGDASRDVLTQAMEDGSVH